MLRNPSVQCYSDNWKRAVFPFVFPLGLLYGVVFPVSVLILLYSNRRNIDSTYFRSFFGFLTSSFRRKVYWYELVMIL